MVGVKVPKILIPNTIWSALVSEAKVTPKGEIRAFALLSPRRKPHGDYQVVDYRERKVEVITLEPEPIFRYRNRIYPKRGPSYRGSLIIQDNLSMTLHYAWWMAREKIDYNINFKIDESGEPIWKAYWVSENITHGEPVPIEVNIA